MEQHLQSILSLALKTLCELALFFCGACICVDGPNSWAIWTKFRLRTLHLGAGGAEPSRCSCDSAPIVAGTCCSQMALILLLGHASGVRGMIAPLLSSHRAGGSGRGHGAGGAGTCRLLLRPHGPCPSPRTQPATCHTFSPSSSDSCSCRHALSACWCRCWRPALCQQPPP